MQRNMELKFLYLNSMKIFLLMFFLSFNIIQAQNKEKINFEDCSYNGFYLYGKVQVVNSFPDIKVQIVESFPDIKIKIVDSFPDKCGLWQFVESFPDFKIQFVDSFPDIKIKFVESFPGKP